MTSIGDRIKHLRTERGLTLRALATHLGIQHGSIAKWESGRTEPATKHRASLAIFFNVSEVWLAFGFEPADAETQRLARRIQNLSKTDRASVLILIKSFEAPKI